MLIFSGKVAFGGAYKLFVLLLVTGCEGDMAAQWAASQGFHPLHGCSWNGFLALQGVPGHRQPK